MDYEQQLMVNLNSLMFEAMFCGFIQNTREPKSIVDEIFNRLRKDSLKIVNDKIEEKVDFLNESAKNLGITNTYDAENIRVDILKTIKRIDKMYYDKFRQFAKQVEDLRGDNLNGTN